VTSKQFVTAGRHRNDLADLSNVKAKIKIAGDYADMGKVRSLLEESKRAEAFFV
jgi:hypothetical protein